MSSYLLSQHVHLCLANDQIVMLDLASDQYVALDLASARSISRLVRGWPVSADPETQQRASAEDNDGTAAARAMVAKGLLTTNPSHGKDAAPASIALPSRSLFEEESVEPSVQARHVRAFVASASSAALRLRCLSIRRVVHRVTTRRVRQARDPEVLDRQRALELVSIFYRLRPFFFTGHNACLFDSLALLSFLARFGIFPTWVFAVQVTPFGAHCWVQHGDTVLNDSVENVRRYTPIMQA